MICRIVSTAAIVAFIYCGLQQGALAVGLSEQIGHTFPYHSSMLHFRGKPDAQNSTFEASIYDPIKELQKVFKQSKSSPDINDKTAVESEAVKVNENKKKLRRQTDPGLKYFLSNTDTIITNAVKESQDIINNSTTFISDTFQSINSHLPVNKNVENTTDNSAATTIQGDLNDALLTVTFRVKGVMVQLTELLKSLSDDFKVFFSGSSEGTDAQNEEVLESIQTNSAVSEKEIKIEAEVRRFNETNARRVIPEFPLLKNTNHSLNKLLSEISSLLLVIRDSTKQLLSHSKFDNISKLILAPITTSSTATTVSTTDTTALKLDTATVSSTDTTALNSDTATVSTTDTTALNSDTATVSSTDTTALNSDTSTTASTVSNNTDVSKRNLQAASGIISLLSMRFQQLIDNFSDIVEKMVTLNFSDLPKLPNLPALSNLPELPSLPELPKLLELPKLNFTLIPLLQNKRKLNEFRFLNKLHQDSFETQLNPINPLLYFSKYSFLNNDTTAFIPSPTMMPRSINLPLLGDETSILGSSNTIELLNKLLLTMKDTMSQIYDQIKIFEQSFKLLPSALDDSDFGKNLKVTTAGLLPEALPRIRNLQWDRSLSGKSLQQKSLLEVADKLDAYIEKNPKIFSTLTDPLSSFNALKNVEGTNDKLNFNVANVNDLINSLSTNISNSTNVSNTFNKTIDNVADTLTSSTNMLTSVIPDEKSVEAVKETTGKFVQVIVDIKEELNKQHFNGTKAMQSASDLETLQNNFKIENTYDNIKNFYDATKSLINTLDFLKQQMRELNGILEKFSGKMEELDNTTHQHKRTDKRMSTSDLVNQFFNKKSLSASDKEALNVTKQTLVTPNRVDSVKTETEKSLSTATSKLAAEEQMVKDHQLMEKLELLSADVIDKSENVETAFPKIHTDALSNQSDHSKDSLAFITKFSDKKQFGGPATTMLLNESAEIFTSLPDEDTELTVQTKAKSTISPTDDVYAFISRSLQSIPKFDILSLAVPNELRVAKKLSELTNKFPVSQLSYDTKRNTAFDKSSATDSLFDLYTLQKQTKSALQGVEDAFQQLLEFLPDTTKYVNVLKD